MKTSKKKSIMKKKSITNLKKIEKKDLKKIKGGGSGVWQYLNGEWHYLEY